MELLERDEELARITARVPGSGRPGALLLLAGEAGVGKTAFVRELAHRLEGRVRALVGYCDPLVTPHPLAPLRDVAAALPESAVAGEAGALARDGVTRALLSRLSRNGPWLMILEDLHWADDATLDLLRFLGRRIAGTRALLVATYRDDALGPRHPLRLTLGHLAGVAGVERMRLAPLSLRSVEILSRGSGLDAAELHRRTGGNPFYVTEVVAVAEHGAGPDAVPATVRDAVLVRAAALGEAARAVLEAVAVLGSRAEPWLLDSVLGDAEESIDACVGSGMLVHAGDTVAFRHELAREALEASIPPERRRRLHAAVLAALEASPDRTLDLPRLAYHAELARNAAAVLAYAPEAGRQAARAGAHREAAAQFARALRFAGGMLGRERAGLLEAFAQAHRVIAHSAEALRAQEEAARLWAAEGDVRAEGAALARLAGIYVHRGRNEDAERAARRALELLESLPPSRELGHAQVVQAALRMRARDSEGAVAWGRRALASAERFGDTELAVRAHCRVASGLLLHDDPAAEAHLSAARRLAQDAGLYRVMALPYVTAASIASEYFRFEEARRSLGDGLAVCDEHDLHSDALYLRALFALTDLYTGDWRAATSVADDIARRDDAEAICRMTALVALGRLRARHGDSGAGEALDEALTLAERTGSLQRLGPVRTARAEAAWLRGDADGARREAEAAYELARAHRHPWFTGELGYWLNRAGAGIQLPSWAAAPFRLEAAGEFQAAADMWHERSCPYEEARALARIPREAALKQAFGLFERLGAQPAAASVARDLRGLGARAIPRGPRPATRAHPAGLTARESQVLALLARGMTNRELAAELHISAKTAGNHVSAVLAKLGVHRRTEAVTVALARGLLTADGAAASDQSRERPRPT